MSDTPPASERGVALLETLVGAGLITFAAVLLFSAWVGQAEFRADAHSARNPSHMLEEVILRLATDSLLESLEDGEWRHYTPEEARTAAILPEFYDGAAIRFNDDFYPYAISIRRTEAVIFTDERVSVHFDAYLSLTRPDGLTDAPERTSLLTPALAGGAFGVASGHGGEIHFATNAEQTEATQAWQTEFEGRAQTGGYLFARSSRTLPRKVERTLRLNYTHTEGASPNNRSEPLVIDAKGRLIYYDTDAIGTNVGNYLTFSPLGREIGTLEGDYDQNNPSHARHAHHINGRAPIDPIRNPKTMMIAWLLANGWTLEPIGGSMESALALGSHAQATEAATWTGAAASAPSCGTGQRLATLAEPHAVFRELELLPATHSAGIEALGLPARTGDTQHQFTRLIRKTRNNGDYIWRALLSDEDHELWPLPENYDLPLEQGWWRVADQSDEAYGLDFTGHLWQKRLQDGAHRAFPHSGFGLKNPAYAFPGDNATEERWVRGDSGFREASYANRLLGNYFLNNAREESLGELLDFMPYPMVMLAAYRAMGMDYAGAPNIPVHDKINPAHRMRAIAGGYQEYAYGGPIIKAGGEEESTWLTLWEALGATQQQQFPAYNWQYTSQTSGGDLFLRPGGHTGGFGLLGLERAAPAPETDCTHLTAIAKMAGAVNNNSVVTFSNDELKNLFTTIMDDDQLGCLVHDLGMASPHALGRTIDPSASISLYDLYDDSTISDWDGSDLAPAHEIRKEILSDSKGAGWWLEQSTAPTAYTQGDSVQTHLETAFEESLQNIDAGWALAILYAVRARHYMAELEKEDLRAPNIYRLRQPSANRMSVIEEKIASADDWTSKTEGKAFLAGTMAGMVAGQTPRPSRNFIMAPSPYFGHAGCSSSYNQHAHNKFYTVSVFGFGALRDYFNNIGVTDDYLPSDSAGDKWRFSMAIIPDIYFDISELDPSNQREWGRGTGSGSYRYISTYGIRKRDHAPGYADITIAGHYYPLDICRWDVVPALTAGNAKNGPSYAHSGGRYVSPIPMARTSDISAAQRGHSFPETQITASLVSSFGATPLPDIAKGEVENRYIGADPANWPENLFARAGISALYGANKINLNNEDNYLVPRDSQIRVFFPDDLLNKISLCVPQE